MDTTIVDMLDQKGYKPVPRRINGEGITAREYATQKGIHKSVAFDILDRAVEAGMLNKQEMYDPGAHAKVSVYLVAKPDKK